MLKVSDGEPGKVSKGLYMAFLQLAVQSECNLVVDLLARLDHRCHCVSTLAIVASSECLSGHVKPISLTADFGAIHVKKNTLPSASRLIEFE